MIDRVGTSLEHKHNNFLFDCEHICEHEHKSNGTLLHGNLNDDLEHYMIQLYQKLDILHNRKRN